MKERPCARSDAAIFSGKFSFSFCMQPHKTTEFLATLAHIHCLKITRTVNTCVTTPPCSHYLHFCSSWLGLPLYNDLRQAAIILNISPALVLSHGPGEPECTISLRSPHPFPVCDPGPAPHCPCTRQATDISTVREPTCRMQMYKGGPLDMCMHNKDVRI